MRIKLAHRTAAVLLVLALASLVSPAAAFDEQTWIKAMRAGSAYRDVGAFDRAEIAFARALRLKPSGNPLALNHWLLAESITRQRRFEDAEPALERAVAVIRKENAGAALLGEALEALVYVLGRGLAPPERAVALALEARKLRHQRKSLWESDPGTLALTHTESGIAFPLRFGLLERTHARRVREGLPDVGVKYAAMLGHGAIEITCIVYPSEGRPAAPLFEGARDRIAERFKDAQQLSGGTVSLNTDRGTVDALAATFSRVDARSGMAVVEKIYLVERAPRLIKTRVTYLADDEPAAEQQIAVLFRQFEWPKAE